MRSVSWDEAQCELRDLQPRNENLKDFYAGLSDLTRAEPGLAELIAHSGTSQGRKQTSIVIVWN